MSSGKKLGTLVVVILKARHLRDSHTFYKQDPYALIRLAGTEKRTNVDPKGGQHPVWDEEFHFSVRDIAPGSDGRTLGVAVYSKETKVDELIGEGKVDISDTLVNGEFDDWVKLEVNGAYRGEIYLEMTFYSASLPLARRPSKLLPKHRLLRPPPTPPKETTSPYLSPRLSPQLQPTSNTSVSPRMQPAASTYLHPSSPRMYPAVSSPSSSPRPDETHLPPGRPSLSMPPRKHYVDPMLKNIPFLDVGPSANTPPPLATMPAPALYSVPSILRPRNIKSSPVPISTRDDVRPISQKDPVDESNRWFQRELAESDAAFAASLAESEGIDVERLRAEEADAELARRLANEERGSEKDDAFPGGWIGPV